MATAIVVQVPIPTDNLTPPSPSLTPEVVIDNLQDLLRRKREIEKNKTKYHLTEQDAVLLLTNANEYTFSDGQVILEEGHEHTSVYRIKSGKVALSKGGVSFCEMSQGWFFGETLLLDNKSVDIIEASLIAKGPVTIAEVNLPFVRKLFEADRLLALKFYRNLASKLSAIFFAISGNLMSPCLVKMYKERIQGREGSSGSFSSNDSGSGTGSGSDEPSSSSLPSSPSVSVTPARKDTIVSCPNVPAASVAVAARTKKRLSKRRSMSIASAAYKTYTLESDGKGVRTARLKNKKIKIVTEAFGFRHKTTIQFSKVKNIVRTSDMSITVIFDPLKAKTLFFKTMVEVEEFYGLALPLVETSVRAFQKTAPGTPLSHASESPRPRPSLLKASADNYLLPLDPQDTAAQREHDKEVVRTLATKVELKKGDVLVEEGDLYQRIYTITKGSCETYKGDRLISTIKEGEVFGEATILHMRPAPVTIKIASETATVLIIPAYKLNELINSNPVIAVRVYRKIAGLVEAKIEKCLITKHQLATEMCPEALPHIPSRLNL